MPRRHKHDVPAGPVPPLAKVIGRADAGLVHVNRDEDSLDAVEDREAPDTICGEDRPDRQRLEVSTAE